MTSPTSSSFIKSCPHHLHRITTHQHCHHYSGQHHIKRMFNLAANRGIFLIFYTAWAITLALQGVQGKLQKNIAF